jgi:choline dehydrogenase-like flavoprotein
MPEITMSGSRWVPLVGIIKTACRTLKSWKTISAEAVNILASEGPVAISAGNNMRNPLYRAFIDAGVEAGYGETDDYNGYRQEGFGQKFMNVDAGVRASTSHAYLKTAKAGLI